MRFLKFILLNVLFLSAIVGLSQTTTLNTIVRSNSGALVPNGTLTLNLANCGLGGPQNPVAVLSVNSSGSVSGSFQENGTFNCTGLDYYSVTLEDANGNLIWNRPYRFTTATSNLASPLTVLPQAVEIGNSVNSCETANGIAYYATAGSTVSCELTLPYAQVYGLGSAALKPVDYFDLAGLADAETARAKAVEATKLAASSFTASTIESLLTGVYDPYGSASVVQGNLNTETARAEGVEATMLSSSSLTASAIETLLTGVYDFSGAATTAQSNAAASAASLYLPLSGGTISGVFTSTSSASEVANFGSGLGNQTQYIGLDGNRALFGHNAADGMIEIGSLASGKGIEFAVNTTAFGSGIAWSMGSDGSFCQGITSSQLCSGSSTFVVTPNGATKGLTFQSTVATGTAPFTVASTTPVANLSIGGNAATATGLSGTQTANYFYGAPSGSGGAAVWRALVAADIPSLASLYGSISGNDAFVGSHTITSAVVAGVPLSLYGISGQTADLLDVYTGAGNKYVYVTSAGQLNTAYGLTVSGGSLAVVAGTLQIQHGGSASTAYLSTTGSIYSSGTATTAFPYHYYNCSGSTAVTTFNTAGTVYGINSCSGFAGYFQDYHVNGGSSVFSVDYQGNVIQAGSQTVTSAAIAGVPLTLYGFSSGQTGDLLDVYNYNGGTLEFSIFKNGIVNIPGELEVATLGTGSGSVSLNFTNGSGGGYIGTTYANIYNAIMESGITGSSLIGLGNRFEYGTSGGTTTGRWAYIDNYGQFGNGTTDIYNGALPMMSVYLHPTVNISTGSTGYLCEICSLPVLTSVGSSTNYFLLHAASGGALVSPNFWVTEAGALGAAGGTFNGKVLTVASTATVAGFNLPPGTAPTSPVNGDCWTTSSGFYCQIAGATVGPMGTGGVTGTLSAANGGTGEAGIITGILYGNGMSAYTAATQAQIQSLIGSSVYDAYGAANTAISTAEAYAANASNLTSGTVAAARLPAINLAASGAGGVTGNLPNAQVSGLGSAALVATSYFDLAGTAANSSNQTSGTVAVARLPGSGVTTVNGASCTIGSTCTAGVFAHAISWDDSTDTTLYTASQVIGTFNASMAGTIPAAGTGTYNGVLSTSVCTLKTAAAASTTFTFADNGTNFGTVVFAASGTTGTFTISSAHAVVSGHGITLTGASTADTAAKGLSCSLVFAY